MLQSEAVVFNLFSTTPPVSKSNFPLFQVSLALNEVYKQMYLLVNLMIKLSAV